MAQYSGTAGSVVYTTGGTTLVGEIKEWSFDGAAETVETTAFGQTYKSRIPGLRDGGGSFSGNFDHADTAQLALVNSFLGGSAVALRLYMSSAKYISIGTAYFEGFSPSMSYDGVGEAGYDFVTSGSYSIT